MIIDGYFFADMDIAKRYIVPQLSKAFSVWIFWVIYKFGIVVFKSNFDYQTSLFKLISPKPSSI